MTYASLEESGDAPVELYRFISGDSVWTYTSGDSQSVLNAETYTPAPITRTLLDNSDEASSDTIDIVMPRDLAVAALFVSGPPPQPVRLVLYRTHRSDPTAAGVVLTGEISAASFNAASVTLTCEGLSASLTRSVPRVLYQSVCNNSLYDSFCTIAKSAYRVADTVTAISGLDVTVTNASAKPNDPYGRGYYAGGIIERGAANGFIESQSGNVLTLMYPIAGLAVGDAINILPGCDKLATTCRDKFSNSDNFAGFPFIPQANPFITGIA